MSKRYDDRRRDDRPSRDHSPKSVKDESKLPSQFGRDPEEDKIEDDRNVLQKMKSSYGDSPLSQLAKCIDGSRKVKVYTRNFKEVRGICTGYCLAFDKHWNVVLMDADEAYLSPKSAKTPFLLDYDPDHPNLKDLPPRKPKKKGCSPSIKDKDDDDIMIVSPDDGQPMTTEASTVVAADGSKKKKRRKRKKNKHPNKMGNRNLESVFIRGDNVVMIAIMDEDKLPQSEEEGE